MMNRRHPKVESRRRLATLLIFVFIIVTIVAVAGCTRSLPADQPIPTPFHSSSSPSLAGTPDGEALAFTHLTPSPPLTTIPPMVLSPSPAYAGVYDGTPTPNPTPEGFTMGSGLETYTVQAGQTLGWIALVFGCTVEEIVTANHLPDANSISAGQTLVIPVNASEAGPDHKLVPDSEMVYGPAYIHFDLPHFITAQGGYLAGYTEEVEGVTRTGSQIVQLVAQRFSVGPRVLLALLELQSGWVTQPQPAAETLVYPLGYVQDYHEGLYAQLSWAALRLNDGYYGWKWGGWATVRLASGSRIGIAPTLNPGSVGVQNCLAQLAPDQETWEWMVGPEGFSATYRRLFGDPFAYAVEPLTPPDLVQPPLSLPWKTGTTWYFTGGPHGGWGDSPDRAALDFVPGDRQLGCSPSSQWAVAAASGQVLRSENGEVILDLDGDGFEQSGWVLLYLHMYSEGRVPVGSYVQTGDTIGRPSCEGGYSTATHLHFARRYNGEWIPAGTGPVPMVLSGWVAHQDMMPYEGTLTRGDQVRTACECWEDDYNGLTADEATDG